MFELRPRQKEAVQKMVSMEAEVGGGILAEHVGAGKTFMVAGLLCASELWPSLVVVPKSMLHPWIDALRSAGVREISVITSRASAAKAKHASFVVVATHAMLVDPPSAFAAVSWGRIVVDEAHVFRNPKCKAYRGLCALKACARWALSATPVQNSPQDLVALARFVGFKTDDIALIRESAILHLSTASPTVHPPLPQLTVRTEFVPMTGDAERRTYDREAQRVKSHSVGGHHGWRQLLLCRFAATHPSLVRGGDGDLHPWDASSKLRMLIQEIVDDHATRKTVVFCDWRAEMSLIESALTEVGLRSIAFHGDLSVDEREDALSEFKRSDATNVLVAQIKCAGQGLNLQTAQRAFLMRPQWNPAVERQAIGRLHRSGQNLPVEIVRLVAAGTVDELGLERLRQKVEGAQEALLCDDLKRTLRLPPPPKSPGISPLFPSPPHRIAYRVFRKSGMRVGWDELCARHFRSRGLPKFETCAPPSPEYMRSVPPLSSLRDLDRFVWHRSTRNGRTMAVGCLPEDVVGVMRHVERVMAPLLHDVATLLDRVTLLDRGMTLLDHGMTVDVVYLAREAQTRSHPGDGRPVRPVHINGGLTYVGGELDGKIVVYRQEDAPKVLVHELLHRYGLDEALIRGDGAAEAEGYCESMACYLYARWLRLRLGKLGAFAYIRRRALRIAGCEQARNFGRYDAVGTEYFGYVGVRAAAWRTPGTLKSLLRTFPPGSPPSLDAFRTWLRPRLLQLQDSFRPPPSCPTGRFLLALHPEVQRKATSVRRTHEDVSRTSGARPEKGNAWRG
ncbi:hypothetical protein CEUSTIGMA_g12213.t1 [Chlamydomonas eustigma]|uniref:Uncharacterized protein n=1 Tax=Chlamydomonas eustigma TaxID=1157962 RepID=A0A250XPE3_9CHLO|nr:hypothetical protein CEUSTIGMA_g12213.t1 [Chlamydomonas eustigma]|eukprot:GAX84792.1 hypothetical protein CEUSTIGMA_g12213.t1 [Chlamydomonas eustigma]